MKDLPHSEHEALADFVEAIRRRSKALKHKFAAFECERVQELRDGEEHERIELRLHQRVTRGLRLSCWLWEDRWCWFDARKSAKTGWAFEWSYSGRLAGGSIGRDIIDALERTHEVLSVSSAPIDLASVSAIWTKLLLTGPKEIQ